MPTHIDLAGMMAQYREVAEAWGPFAVIDEEEAARLDPAWVWTQNSPDSDYDSIINGYFGSNLSEDYYGYYRASRPCNEPRGSVSVIEVIRVDRDDCGPTGDSSDCISCQDSGHTAIDVEEVFVRKQVDLTSSAEIWSQRVPGGTFGRVCVPADYAKWPELPRPAWISEG